MMIVRCSGHPSDWASGEGPPTGQSHENTQGLQGIHIDKPFSALKISFSEADNWIV